MTLDYDISVMRVGRKRRVHTEIAEKEHPSTSLRASREHGELDRVTAVSADVRDGKAPVLKITLGAALARVMSLEEIK